MAITQHKIGSGFDAHSTADEVLAGLRLSGKNVLITGGYSGLGLEATRALVRAGAHVVVPARRPAVAREALHGITRTEVREFDLSDPDSIRTFSHRFLETGRTVDIVINNAGVMAYPHRLIAPGWEAHFAINHLGHFALVNRLRPALAPTGARVVSVASSGHFLSDIRWDDPHLRHGYDHWSAYGQSKTANALFAMWVRCDHEMARATQNFDQANGPPGLRRTTEAAVGSGPSCLRRARRWPRSAGPRPSGPALIPSRSGKQA
ncbi:SDR family NAD(P)-dependent oxidoreductase [Streptosporangium sp. NBC_01755]|uniref:SDR family NAD(P)-dependent oxidoreductase n=1 Tax=unclassified Streptosporangium TaxID=2632669 RepID=UPI002DD9D797|nr:MULTISPECIES: SDR family NAD(P)-dependent oxidoreductase [unclassified Streptosporangium]WSA26828.1 SDR family NAD(P)-dependent oxidoreductase [Streptosporangium sp. NBC_01810]WSD01747.1 SDR family NAD(P)-dependent oxidoreductase [Streptosporangium sp. NBC_01755]